MFYFLSWKEKKSYQESFQWQNNLILRKHVDVIRNFLTMGILKTIFSYIIDRHIFCQSKDVFQLFKAFFTYFWGAWFWIFNGFLAVTQWDGISKKKIEKERKILKCRSYLCVWEFCNVFQSKEKQYCVIIWSLEATAIAIIICMICKCYSYIICVHFEKR